MSFKIPRLKSKPPDRDLFSGLRRFLLDEVTDQKDIGVGSYGLVKFGRYPTDGQQSRDVVVKIPRDITGYEKEFAKEAKLLNSVKGHPNIVSFEAVSVSPFAIMTEYLKFLATAQIRYGFGFSSIFFNKYYISRAYTCDF